MGVLLGEYPVTERCAAPTGDTNIVPSKRELARAPRSS